MDPAGFGRRGRRLEVGSRAKLEAVLGQADVLLRGISVAVTVHDAVGQLFYVNDMAAWLCGFADAAAMLATPAAEILARFEMVDENGKPLVRSDLPGARALRGELPEPLIVGFRDRASGDTRWSLVRADAIIGESGEPELAINVFHDATGAQRQKQASRLLGKATAALSSSLHYETTLAGVADALVPDLADWCIVELLEEPSTSSSSSSSQNPQGLRRARRTVAVVSRAPEGGGLAHLPRTSKSSSESSSSPSPSSSERVSSPVERALATGEAFLHSEIDSATLRTYESEAWHEALLRDLRSVMCIPILAGGRIEGAITLASTSLRRRFDDQDLELAREIGRRAGTAIGNARAYQAAKDAVSARDEFLSIAGHELRTPLATLMLQLESMKRIVNTTTGALVESAAVTERVDRTLDQAHRLSRLIDELLDVTRVSYGRLSLETVPIDLAELVRDVGARFVDEAARAGSTLTVSAEASCRGTFDGRRLERVLSNLISNAIKYGNGQPINVTCTREGDRVSIEVVDHGSGVTPDEAARIFDRFERGSSSQHHHRERRGSGLGLGLWISREIVTAHGGTIRVASEPNRGAVFTVELAL